jgi:hypothetical protein
MSDQVEPPAWTQKNRQGTKAKATDKDRDKDKVKVKDKEAESATLPKRRRKGGPPKSVAG